MTDTSRPMGFESQLLPTDVFKGA